MVLQWLGSVWFRQIYQAKVMVVERLTRSWTKRYEYKEVIRYSSGLQGMTPPVLSEHLTEVVNTHPQLQDHTEEINVARCEIFSVHGDQTRKQSGDPGHVHPEKVALITTKMYEFLGLPITKDIFIAALMHDTVEDGPKGYRQRLWKSAGHGVTRLVDVLTRHNTRTADGGFGEPIGHREAARKVRTAHDNGVEGALIIKFSDRVENVLDQPNVHKPPLTERILYSRTPEYKKSAYGKWKRMKRDKHRIIREEMLHDQPDLANIMRLAIRHTKKEINRRPRKSFRQ